MSDGAPIVELEELVKTFVRRRGLLGGAEREVHAVRGVSLRVAAGEALGLVGESGSGKTTLGRCLLGLERPTAGTVRYRGDVVSTLSPKQFRPYRHDLQMVFQDPTSSLNPRMRARDIVGEPLRLLTDLNAARRADRVRDALADVGLDPGLGERFRHQLSGGQRQRVGIARSIALRPRFLVLDEPVSSLDAAVRAEVLDLLRRVRREHDLTYLLISHDLDDVRSLCDRVAILYRGALVEYGDTEQIFADPHHPYTRLLLASVLRVQSPRVRPNGSRQARERLMDVVARLETTGPPPELVDVGGGQWVAPH